MTRITSVEALGTWIAEAKPGERCVYFEGFLGLVRERMMQLDDSESPFEDSPNEDRNRHARKTLALVNKARQYGTPTRHEVVKTTSGQGARGLGLAHMFTQRLGADHYLYILERR